MKKFLKYFLLAILAIILFVAISLGLDAISNNGFKFDFFSQKVEGKDFNALKSEYPDCIAWIQIDDTSIDYPIVKSPTNDYFYLTHDATGNTDSAGAIFIEKSNSSNFDDPVTLVYGHNMIDDRVFSHVLKFQNANFFNSHDKFYIYTPGHKLTYTIISAYVYSNKHIINSYDFSNADIRKSYYEEVLNPKTMIKNCRGGVQLNNNDKIVQLSTCLNDLSQSDKRYILTGKLEEDEETK